MRIHPSLVIAASSLAAVGLGAGGRAATVTFTRDVAPILYKSCVECHRPGEIAPMPLVTYQDARPWAKSIRDYVASRRMPPWPADPSHEHFANDRRLAEREISTIVAWVNAGAPKGDDRDLPPAPRFVEGWSIGQPDLVLQMSQEFEVPAEGVVPYKYFTVPTNLTEDKWVTAAEFRPGNRAVVHHIIGFIQEPGKKFGEGPQLSLGGTAPGDPPKRFPKGTAKRLKAGSSIVFQVHYTPNGEAVRDRSSVGIIFAREPVEKTVLAAAVLNARFAIPPGDANYEVKSSWTAKEDVTVLNLMPHMHVRGKDFTYTVTFPDGRKEVILRVPRYDFNWQLTYDFKQPLRLPAGSRVDCVAHFDNSAANKSNPDPAKEVRWGDQTWEEMMIGFFDYTRDAETLPGQVPPAAGQN